MEQPNEYALTDQERAALHGLNAQNMAAKLRVYNLNVELDKALAAVVASDAQWTGALTLLANANGMVNARLAEDFSKLTRTS